jgi:hypothetical protein
MYPSGLCLVMKGMLRIRSERIRSRRAKAPALQDIVRSRLKTAQEAQCSDTKFTAHRCSMRKQRLRLCLLLIYGRRRAFGCVRQNYVVADTILHGGPLPLNMPREKGKYYVVGCSAHLLEILG